jgi:hypothetical protein
MTDACASAGDDDLKVAAARPTVVLGLASSPLPISQGRRRTQPHASRWLAGGGFEGYVTRERDGSLSTVENVVRVLTARRATARADHKKLTFRTGCDDALTDRRHPGGVVEYLLA